MESSTGVDLISSLCDDLLLNVLDLLPSAADVVRTSALSRRWRQLWTRAPTLRFTIANRDDDYEFLLPAVDSPRMIGSIDAVLAGRAAADVDNLEISFLFRCGDNEYLGFPAFGYSVDHDHGADINGAHVAAWLRYGARHAVKSFVLEVPVPPRYWGGTGELSLELPVTPPDEDDDGEETLLELPGCCRAEAVSLTLANRNLKLPAEGSTFHALTDLNLANVWIDDGSDGDQRRRLSLSHLVSSPCCPRLRRLSLEHVGGLHELALRSGTLEELEIFDAATLLWLNVDAPRLRVLDVDNCYYLQDGSAEMRIAAPNLETLACANLCHLERLRFDGAPSVRRLEKLTLQTHVLDTTNHHHQPATAAAKHSESTMWLLNKCTGVNQLGLRLMVPELREGGYEDAMRGVPKLDNVTTLDVEVCSGYGHRYGASLVNLLAMFHGLEWTRKPSHPCAYIRGCSNPACKCGSPASWRSREVPLEHLRELEMAGVRGWEDETSLVKLLFASAAAGPGTALERMTVEHERTYEAVRGRKSRELELELSAAAATARGRGRWTALDDGSNGVCVWTTN